MKRDTQTALANGNPHGHKFSKVLNGRKQPIRGLWKRNDRFYAQLKIEDPITGKHQTRRIPLVTKQGVPVKSTAEAVAEMERLRVGRADNNLPVLRQTPLFRDYSTQYLEFIKSGAKKATTAAKEEAILRRWKKRVGNLRIDQIKRAHINRFIEDRLKAKTNPRTVNLDVIVLRQVLKRALSDGLILRLPTEGLRPLKTKTPKRELITAADLHKLCTTAFATKVNKEGKEVPLTKNAQPLVAFIWFMAYSGARRSEALAMRWDDVDFDLEQVHIGASGDTKNRKARIVDFNPQLRAHLAAMKTQNDQVEGGISDWLFPSPQRGGKDTSSKTFQESLRLVRERAGLPHFTFHDCRHHFISMAVMSGVDFMTIAAWVGHQDGGVLIGKVYGHLANEHRQAMARKMNFGTPQILTAEQGSPAVG